MSRDLSRRSAFGAKAERDRKLELALKHELRRSSSPTAEPALRSFSEGGCVDAETLGAWADGGLDPAQMAAVELHVSTCARCQAIVGATARSVASATEASGTEGAGAFSLWKWWLAPLAAGAAAVMLWMVVPQGTMQAPPTPVVVEIPDAPAAPKETPPPAAVAEQTASEPTRERANVAPPPLQDRAQRAEERAADALGAAAAPPPPAPAAPPAPAEAMLQKNARLAAAPLEIISPDQAVRWRIFSGAIERSEDSGASWIRIQPLADTITGGTAPTRSSCWLIGANGTVFVTTDGATFTRVPLPEPVDLTAITATNARSATVTTADGRRFRTDDAGRTWRQIQA